MGRGSRCCVCNLSKKAFGVELVVVAQVALTVISVLITYILAQHYDHVSSYLPFISEAAAKGLERCLFSFSANTSAILGLAVVYVRFKQIAYLHVDSVLDNKCLNMSSLICGILSGTGLMLVANFQVYSVYSVHVIGACTLFAFGLFYVWLQTIISYKIYKTQLTRHLGVCMLWSRIFITAASTIIIVLFAVAGVLKSGRVHLLHNYPDDFYMLASSCEWALVLSFLLYYLTFHNELANISVGFSVQKRYYSEEIITSSYGENTPLTI